jgi:diaminohydroxyphosphoribosylaminopyrimidine deaminase/5-amino-6-(5-phosphoribosylamino)uracil reductase
MRRAIRLAMNGRGRAEPNPLVGCVIVKNGSVIGEGFHEQFGGPHAEPNALAACKAAGESSAGATAYVTLEPCCHTHKKTPPCVPRLIEAKLDRVVIGCPDPNPDVDGRAISLLRSAGIGVTVVLEDEARQLIAPFLARVRFHRPYVTLKWAESADGKVAGPGRKPVRISSETSMRAMHELRSRCDAIMVGIGTVLSDDPLLTARGVLSARPLRRVVLDSRLRIPIHSRLVQSARDHSLIVYKSRGVVANDEFKKELLFKFGVEAYSAETDANGHPALDYVLRHLEKSVTHLLVEPGPELARSFFREKLVDRVWVFRSPMPIDDPTAPAAPGLPADFLQTAELDLNGDRLTEYLNCASPAFFNNIASPDLRLAASLPRR